MAKMLADTGGGALNNFSMNRIFSLILLLAAGGLDAADAVSPVVPGLQRDGLDQRARGLVLIGEFGCVACHRAGDFKAELNSRKAPNLQGVAARINPRYLEAFLLAPHKVKPGTRMPDIFRGMAQSWFPKPVSGEIAEALAHYLVSLQPGSFKMQAPDHVAAAAGEKLFHSVGCVVCHSPRNEAGKHLLEASSVSLAGVEKKYSVESLAAFLEAPHEARPSGRMPDLHLDSIEAWQLANYLCREAKVPASLRYTLYLDGMDDGIAKLQGKEQRGGIASGFDLGGFKKYRTDFALRFEGYFFPPAPGEYAFELACDQVGTLSVNGEPLVSLSEGGRARKTVRLDARSQKLELVYLHVDGDPKLELLLSGPGIEKGPVSAALLSSEKKRAAPREKFFLDEEKARMGKVYYGGLLCARCHGGGPDVQTKEFPELSRLDPARGCLSPAGGRGPYFALGKAQREDIRAALATPAYRPAGEEKIRLELARFNCIGCHERGALGGVTRERNDYFTSADPKLGEPGRLPPPLTGTGAKLQLDWLRNTIANGQRIRPYVKVRMPAFGAENVSGLAELFAAADEVPAVVFDPLPKDRKKARVVTDVGHRIVGDRGMNCIACHTFRGKGTSSMASVDIVESTTKRLNKDWFYHYMLEPVRFRPNTIMPEFFAGGVSVLGDLAGGDPKKQLNALWYYLAEGRNTRQPSGLVRPSMEIVVADEAVMLRRSVQDTGKRGISVGYPLKVNLTFDAENVCLNQLWRGKFIDPGGVWRGQGSGNARIIPRERLKLGRGASLQRLSDEDSPWPADTSRSLGIRFKGYRLDEKRRPTFSYVYGGTIVSDKPMDLLDKKTNRVYLARTIRLEGGELAGLYFRAAVHQEVTGERDGSATVGRKVNIRASGSLPGGKKKDLKFLVRPSGKAREAVVAVVNEGGAAEILLEYRWLEEEK